MAVRKKHTPAFNRLLKKSGDYNMSSTSGKAGGLKDMYRSKRLKLEPPKGGLKQS